MKLLIEKMDHLGNGIGFIDNKVVFVPKTIPGDVVEIKVVKEKKNFIEAEVIKFIKRSDNYIPSFCPFYDKCGGCHLQNMDYEDTLDYKKDRLINILNKINIQSDIEIIGNKKDKYYRNKIELKVKNGKIGFYEAKSHSLLEINECMITRKTINSFIKELNKMNIKNGDILIRCNYNDELLVAIWTKDNIVYDESVFPNYKVVGIILNDKCIYGEDHFIDMIDNKFFEVSYNSFFQVNDYINAKLFSIIKSNVEGENVLDLYSGVGTLAIIASDKARKVYAIENLPNAVKNALKNAQMNRKQNINFMLGNVEDKIKFIKDDIDAVIIDPPRKGLDDYSINQLLEINPKKIVYISCETQSLVNNTKILLDNYKVKKIYLLDMFSYTYHCEVVLVLEKDNC